MQPQSIKFSIPGKTFICGEYGALFAGASLVLTTHPNFDFLAQPGSGQHPFHVLSPAGLYIQKNISFFQQFDLKFQSPQNQSGGFGGSTAEFIGCYLLKNFHSDFVLQKPVDILAKENKSHGFVRQAWREYRELFADKSIPPSGVDLIAQMLGGLIFVHEQKIGSIDWPFLDKNILLFKTKNKIATHTHLEDIEVSLEKVSQIQSISLKIVEAIQDKKWTDFMSWQKQLKIEMQKQNWLHSQTLQSLEWIEGFKGVDGARGCGSLGADVIAVFVDLKTFELKAMKDLEYVASLSQNMSQGIVMEVS